MRLEDYDDTDNEVLDDTFAQLYDSLSSGKYLSNKLRHKNIKYPKKDDYIIIEVAEEMRISDEQIFASPNEDNAILVQFPLTKDQKMYLKILANIYHATLSPYKTGINIILTK